MFESFSVALWVVIPMALLMGIGALVRHVGFIDRPAMRQYDRLIFRLFTPVLLFKNIYDTNLSSAVNTKLFAFAIAGMLLVFLMAYFIPRRFLDDPKQTASVGQALIRSNYVLFGIAVAESLYGKGNAGTVAMIGAVAVPMTNALGVVILELNLSRNAKPGKLLLSILKNPMVIAAFLALSLKLVRFQFPEIIYSVIVDIASATTTISFISLGVSLDLGELRTNLRPLGLGLFFRMVMIPMIFLPLSALAGFRGQELCALMVLFAAPAAVNSYPMAVAMGADGALSGQLVCTTTVVSIFTMFVYTLGFQMLGLL